jgi:NAD dependent epimerase/dehydratase family enzyme
LPPQARAFRWGLGAVLGTGRQYWPWIEVGDAAALFVEAVRNPDLTGPVHAVSGTPVTQREFARTLGKVLQRPVLFRLPERLLRLGMGEMADLFLHGQKAFPAPVSKVENEPTENSLFPVLTKLLK